MPPYCFAVALINRSTKTERLWSSKCQAAHIGPERYCSVHWPSTRGTLVLLLARRSASALTHWFECLFRHDVVEHPPGPSTYPCTLVAKYIYTVPFSGLCRCFEKFGLYRSCKEPVYVFGDVASVYMQSC